MIFLQEIVEFSESVHVDNMQSIDFAVVNCIQMHLLVVGSLLCDRKG